MSGRILMATVASLALAMPAMAQEGTAPANSEPQAAPQTEQLQTEQGLPAEGAAEGAGEESPAMTEEAPAESEQAPAMAEEPPAGTEPSPTMTEETPAETDEGPAMTEEQPTDQPADQQMAAEPPADMEFLQVQEEAQFLANDEVIGKDVVNDQDEKVGTIADLVMDQDQKLVGVVLSVGGFLGIGDKWVAVPVAQIDFPSEEQPARLLAAVTEEQLTAAPDFITRATIEAEQAQSEAPMQPAPAPAAPAQ